MMLAVDIARGLASDVLDQILNINTQFVVNLVEILSLRTPSHPVDLQILLDNNWKAGQPTELDVRMKTNLSVALFEALDVTFTLPPLSVGVSGPLPNSTNTTTELFVVTVPSITSKKPSSSLLAEANVSVPAVYEVASWLQDLVEDLDGKYVNAHPVYDGSLWSLIIEPVLVEVSVADAIDPNRASRKNYLSMNGTDSSMKDDASNETWSKAVFALQVSVIPLGNLKIGQISHSPNTP